MLGICPGREVLPSPARFVGEGPGEGAPPPLSARRSREPDDHPLIRAQLKLAAAPVTLAVEARGEGHRPTRGAANAPGVRPQVQGDEERAAARDGPVRPDCSP